VDGGAACEQPHTEDEGHESGHGRIPPQCQR
jgi:hypothetical protein